MADSSPHRSRPEVLAPIALFVYNRPEHARRTVQYLCANRLAQQSDLFVFADAAKNKSAATPVETVRKFIRTVDGFRCVTIVEREQNLGLAASVIRGVTQVCDQFGRAIVMEDDLLTAPDFLTFMNSALQRYVDEPRVFSVSGFNHAVRAPRNYACDAFFTYRSSSWGWGTWKDRWAKADWNVSDYARFSLDKDMQRLFNRGGKDLSRMLESQMAGKLDSWAIRWAYTHFRQNAVTLLPVESRVYNIGLDGSGTHCRWVPLRQRHLVEATEAAYRYPDSLRPDPYFAAEIQRVQRRSLVRKVVGYLRQIAPKRRHFDSNRASLKEEARSAKEQLGTQR